MNDRKPSWRSCNKLHEENIEAMSKPGGRSWCTTAFASFLVIWTGRDIVARLSKSSTSRAIKQLGLTTFAECRAGVEATIRYVICMD